MNKLLIALALVLPPAGITLAQSPRITFQADTLYPEGLAHNPATNEFLVSSVKYGTIGTVSQQGQYKPFVQDSTLHSSFGMKVDSRSNRLWVCVSDPNYSVYSTSKTFKKMARLVSYDLTSGKQRSNTDLAALSEGHHFANDLATDSQGNWYVTDSYAAAVYRVDPQGKATIFLQDDRFKTKDVGLNGIIYHPDGFLLVSHSQQGVLYKMELKTKKVTKISIQQFFPGADGLIWDAANQQLALIQNKGVDKIHLLSSRDKWITAQVTRSTPQGERFENPTTGVWMEGKMYVLNAKLHELADPKDRKSKEFSIQQVRFEDRLTGGK